MSKIRYDGGKVQKIKHNKDYVNIIWISAVNIWVSFLSEKHMWQFDHFISLGKSARNTPKDIIFFAV